MPDRLLDGQRVLLGVTGGIAAYKAADLCSKLVQAGAQVDVILTEAATRFIAPLTFSALSGRSARVDMWSEPGGDPIPHVRMAAHTDLVIVAPLSANTLAKLALGVADNLLTATLLATPIRKKEVTSKDEDVTIEKEEGALWVLAPAMESHMWANPLTQAHMAAVHHLHKAHVHALRKPRAGLHRRAQGAHRSGVHVVHQQHAVGVAHGDRRYENSSWLFRLCKGQRPIPP